MKFWDTSAVVPLLVNEAGTAAASHVLEDDPEIIVWWGTRVECVSALARYAREQGMSAAHLVPAHGRLAGLADRWSEILASELLRSTAERIVRTHPLRGADAMQLAAALIASGGEPGGLAFVSFDVRQRDAARREGFPVLPDDMPGPRLVPERAHQRGARRTGG
ncbi:MAG TPA: type II toxin-antitoxin system VapC family toxin [Gemmatimonadaceae bacterium]|nr:type II toxin-antitoxin system VapC family toxin [Gemmatimonadaceae bacterium]